MYLISYFCPLISDAWCILTIEIYRPTIAHAYVCKWRRSYFWNMCLAMELGYFIPSLVPGPLAIWGNWQSSNLNQGAEILHTPKEKQMYKRQMVPWKFRATQIGSNSSRGTEFLQQERLPVIPVKHITFQPKESCYESGQEPDVLQQHRRQVIERRI